MLTKVARQHRGIKYINVVIVIAISLTRGAKIYHSGAGSQVYVTHQLTQTGRVLNSNIVGARGKPDDGEHSGIISSGITVP